MKRSRLYGGTVAVTLAAVVAGIVAGAGGAGNRDATPNLSAPTPGTVGEPATRGESVLFTSSFSNTTSANFVKVTLRVPLASAAGTFVVGTCAVQSRDAAYWYCDVGTVVSGATSPSVAFVIDTPDTGTELTLTQTVEWSAKEGFNDSPGASGQDIWAASSVITLYGEVPDQKKAAGFQVAAASAADCKGGILRTGGAVSAANEISTEVCLPLFLLPALGLYSRIEETDPSGPAGPEQSTVCLTDTGLCSGTAFVFTTPVRFSFKVSMDALGLLNKIGTVSHDGVALPACPRTNPAAGAPCASIKADNKNKLYDITAYDFDNGSWTFG